MSKHQLSNLFLLNLFFSKDYPNINSAVFTFWLIITLLRVKISWKSSVFLVSSHTTVYGLSIFVRLAYQDCGDCCVAMTQRKLWAWGRDMAMAWFRTDTATPPEEEGEAEGWRESQCYGLFRQEGKWLFAWHHLLELDLKVTTDTPIKSVLIVNVTALQALAKNQLPLPTVTFVGVCKAPMNIACLWKQFDIVVIPCYYYVTGCTLDKNYFFLVVKEAAVKLFYNNYTHASKSCTIYIFGHFIPN